MAGRGQQALRPRERLRRAAEFRRVLQAGLRLDGPLFKLVAVDNGREYDRLGVAAGRQVGGAVQRSRARRLLRETFRRNKRAAGRGCDLVLVAKPDIVNRTQPEVEREYRERLRRLADRRAPRPRRPPPDGGG